MKKSIADTFNAMLKTPWIWLVIVLTIGLTVLFYFSQKPQIVIYSRYVKSLTEYQLLESRLMRSMEHVRSGYGVDSVLIQSQTMTLREMMVSFSREMDELNILGTQTPPPSVTNRFERDVLGKVAGMRRYVTARMDWMDRWNTVKAEILALQTDAALAVVPVLDSARAGFPVSRSPDIILPDTLLFELDALLSENNDLAMAWSRFDNDITLMYCMELVQFFQMRTLDEMSLKSKIPMIFYFLSIVLLLSTFFFLFRSKI